MNLNNFLFPVWNRLLQRNSNLLFSSILRTPPIATHPEAETIVYTLLNQPNVNGYLLAIKSLLHHTAPHYPLSVVVQSDGTLTQSCQDRLVQHLPGITIHDRQSAIDGVTDELSRCPALKAVLPAVDFAPSLTPVYFKLLNVLSRFTGKRVIQIDSDILFIKSPDYILDWIAGRAEDAFYSDGGSTVGPEFVEAGFTFPRVNINRFNSGVFGFRNVFSFASLVPVFERLQAFPKNVYRKWDVEQAIWAVLLNELQQTKCLDDVSKDYVGNGWRTYSFLKGRTTVVHFVGSSRFKRLTYLRLAQEVVGDLRHLTNAEIGAVSA